MSEYKIEICANSVKSCIEAEKGGAYRVELCSSIPEGGTTPSIGEIVIARKHLGIKLNVIIRPRGGDFLYTPLEIETMKYDIEMCRNNGVDGVVFGVLNRDGSINTAVCKELMDCCGNMSTTFHRAFDVCSDPFKALEEIIGLGFDRILTSGQKANAYLGVDLLKDLVKKADDRIIIMPGCGVNSSNIAQIAGISKCKEFHLSARNPITSEMVYRNNEVSMGGEVKIDEFIINVTSADIVNSTIEILNKQQ